MPCRRPSGIFIYTRPNMNDFFLVFLHFSPRSLSHSLSLSLSRLIPFRCTHVYLYGDSNRRLSVCVCQVKRSHFVVIVVVVVIVAVVVVVIYIDMTGPDMIIVVVFVVVRRWLPPSAICSLASVVAASTAAAAVLLLLGFHLL